MAAILNCGHASMVGCHRKVFKWSCHMPIHEYRHLKHISWMIKYIVMAIYRFDLYSRRPSWISMDTGNCRRISHYHPADLSSVTHNIHEKKLTLANKSGFRKGDSTIIQLKNIAISNLVMAILNILYTTFSPFYSDMSYIKEEVLSFQMEYDLGVCMSRFAWYNNLPAVHNNNYGNNFLFGGHLEFMRILILSY